MNARIYQPSQNAMQQGQAKNKRWTVEVMSPQSKKKSKDPLMGWTSSSNTIQQVSLFFSSLEDAILYAKAQGYSYTVEKTHSKKIKPKAYEDNFSYTRTHRWTH